MNPEDNLKQLESELKSERMKGHINFSDMWLSTEDNATLLCIECGERDIADIKSEINLNKYSYVERLEPTNQGNRKVIPFKISGVEYDGVLG